MRTDTVFSFQTWLNRLRPALLTAVLQAEAELSRLKFSEQGVPVIIPVVSPLDEATPNQSSGIAPLLQELLYHLILEIRAKDPALPTTKEIAHAQTVVGMLAFDVSGFPASFGSKGEGRG